MTRINTIEPLLLTDQHLMAEYRELPMVFASGRRSNPDRFNPSEHYLLNTGHVTFFFNKKEYLKERWVDLIVELYNRNYNIDPLSRNINWTTLDKFPQIEWRPNDMAQLVNLERLLERVANRPDWYRYYGKRITPDEYKQLIRTQYSLNKP